MRWLRWTGVAAVILVAAVAGCIFVPGVFFVGVSPGEGVVVNTETERPISGALVILECRRALLHGSRVVKYVARETDEAGRYHFGFFDVAYLSVYDGFQKAKRIALTREEWDFVTQAYCRRLIDVRAADAGGAGRDEAVLGLGGGPGRP